MCVFLHVTMSWGVGECVLNVGEMCNRLCVCVFVCDYVQYRLGLTRFRGKKSMRCVCVLTCKCVFKTHTYTHKYTQMGMCEWVYGWNLSSASQPQVQFCTHWHTTVSKALPNQGKMTNNYDSKVIMEQPYILQLPTHDHHLRFFFFFFFKPGHEPSSGPATLTKKKGCVHQLNPPKDRNRETPSVTT